MLHTFVDSDGVEPDAGVIIDSKGNLYGETAGGGSGEGGTVFELSPTPPASKQPHFAQQYPAARRKRKTGFIWTGGFIPPAKSLLHKNLGNPAFNL